MSNNRRGDFEITWPLYRSDPKRRFADDPSKALSTYTPQSGVLRELSELPEVPESGGDEAEAVRVLRESVPPPAPDWMRAAQTLVNQLSRLLSAGDAITPEQQSSVARVWAAWSMGGASEAHILRVAHLVMRAHSALMEVPKDELAALQSAQLGAARVLHTGLPSAVRESMPIERALLVIRQIHDIVDPWAAIVQGSAELLGWTDYARIHAAAVIRSAIERDHAKRHVD